MITTCNNCEDQLQRSLCDIPPIWRDQIVKVLCSLFREKPRHCEIDLAAKLCNLPKDWRDEMVEILCKAFTVSACDVDCQACEKTFEQYLLSIPKKWRLKIINIVCDIILTKGCPPPECVTYLITPFAEIDQTYPYRYQDCYRELVNATIYTEAVIICAVKGSLVIDSRFNVIQINNECDLESSDCLCLRIHNIEWDVPHVVAHKISYNDCGDGEFVDVDVDGIEYFYICADPITIVTNFGYAAVSSGPCITECLNNLYYLADRYICEDGECTLDEEDVPVYFADMFAPDIDNFYTDLSGNIYQIKSSTPSDPDAVLLQSSVTSTTCEGLCDGPCYHYQVTNLTSGILSFAYLPCGEAEFTLINIPIGGFITFCTSVAIIISTVEFDAVPIGTCG